ncbi:MAG: hypothetical protein GY853_09485 [PVC group bacterium]|nr:hypothetical protein [PVC group bacterium]
MKQNPGDNKCVAYVAAKITGVAVNEFESFANTDPPYTDGQLFKFLAMNNFVPMLCIPGGKRINGDDIFELEIKLENMKAVLITENKQGGSHLIYWDGEKVYDPDPMRGENTSLSSYRILRWTPIIRIS